MWFKLLVVVWCSPKISALLYPIVIPHRLYNYTPPESEVTFHLHHSASNKDGNQVFIGDHESVQKSGFDPESPTKMIIHGWTHDKDIPWVVEMRQLMIRKHWNVLVVDWSSLSKVIYVEARIHAPIVAKQIRYLMLFLMDHANLNLESLHLVGHSMGAQIAAMAGHQIHEMTGMNIGRISGLDPAAPLFEWPHIESLDDVLDPSDANFVDVIHTNGGHIGMITPAGHIDFYPNGGEFQPDCEMWSCSHLRAVEYFIASLRNPHAFKSYHHEDWDAHNKKHPEMMVPYPMGIAANPDMPHGIYYVETDDIMLNKFVSVKTLLSDNLALAHVN